MSDYEDDEQLMDYSQLLKKNHKKLKRGSKANDTAHVDIDQLDKARSALFECIGQVTKVKNTSRGVLATTFPYYTSILQNKGTHLHTMGFSIKGVITLYPEEAAFLVSRSALIVTAQDKPILFEDYCQILCEKGDNWITFEKYQVYAYLKRLGFIVMRAHRPIPTPKAPIQVSVWRYLLNRMTAWIYDPNKNRPLAWNYSHRTYASVYSTLQIIPSSPWYRPFMTFVDWYVYKPKSGWKKKDPGVPDFKVIVKNIHDPMPSLDEQAQLFTQDKQFIVALVGDAESITFLKLAGDDMQDISQRIQPIPSQKRRG
ncbi:uncharacterized protein B0P05DRAFT_576674 [Gilbertella persicaria]|uniref:uncharacterized protein n=1 Tax=Gilbertella persicaria TaxID=101096 RepID=UPI00221FCBB4|nr:uncharacterized protein B0P05DRAFT_576674 [Gilbertella persicaria]KAI8098346.1 hypothetical protein B0P05DRAFT_576674 [Gilbertella persicaria]